MFTVLELPTTEAFIPEPLSVEPFDDNAFAVIDPSLRIVTDLLFTAAPEPELPTSTYCPWATGFCPPPEPDFTSSVPALPFVILKSVLLSLGVIINSIPDVRPPPPKIETVSLFVQSESVPQDTVIPIDFAPPSAIAFLAWIGTPRATEVIKANADTQAPLLRRTVSLPPFST